MGEIPGSAIATRDLASYLARSQRRHPASPVLIRPVARSKADMPLWIRVFQPAS